MSPAMMIMGVIVIILLYMYFFYKTGETNLGNKLDLSQSPPAINADKIVDPTGQVYSYDTWVYVTKYDGIGDSLFSRIATSDGNSANKNIGISVTGASPTLTVSYVTNGSTKSPKTLSITDNFPIQTWVHVIVSVNSSYIDVYVNGKLTKSIKEADGIEAPSSSSPIVFGSWSGNKLAYLSKFYRRTTPVDPATAWSLYSDGNGSNKFSNYLGTLGMDVSLKKDSIEYSKLNIF